MTRRAANRRDVVLGAGLVAAFAYLREFPVDILEVDRSFVRPLGTDAQATALLRSIIAIADALRLDVVVEGVEERSRLEIVTALGCEVAHGYYFGHRVDAPTLAELLASPDWAPAATHGRRSAPGPARPPRRRADAVRSP